ncbi:ribonucleotide reductase inhibitor-domain-containing protein [Aspergillus desertorum]
MASTKSELSKRRRFQPPITTFFTPSSDHNGFSSPSHLSYDHYSAVTNSPTPVVPAKVQASLLSVGMRVRKAIADGYKTQQAKADKYTTFTSDHNNNDETSKARTTNTSLARTLNAPSARSELAPFCGMSKSNEYITTIPQPLPTVDHDHHIIRTDEDDAFSLPPSSQESVDLALAPVPTFMQKKRSHHDFDFDPYEDDSEEITPLHRNQVTHITRRTILSPTSNYQRRALAAQKYKHTHTMDLDDFEEAAFLRRREELDDMDIEGEIRTN